MPRGSGKTTLAEAAVLWTTLYGYRRFAVAIGSDASSALEIIDSVKRELECNDFLYEDFPEVCYPIRCIEGIALRCAGQLFDGERTHILWTNEEIRLPTIPDSVASGAILAGAGLTGRIRGLKRKLPNGTPVRPDFALLDDPQTDESARSPSQVVTRERLIKGAVLGLAGPGQKIAAVMPCTVIAPGDLADRFLDRKKYPEWQGERAKLMYAFPANEQLWEQYFRIREDGLRAGDGGASATTFYRANQAALDLGAKPAWEARFNPDEASAIQHAMNLRADLGEAAFAAEYQNEPIIEKTDTETLSVDEIIAKTNGVPRGIIPIGCDHLTCYIDVQGSLLYWAVLAFGPGFTGAPVDYGSYPDQRKNYFTLADAKNTLKKKFPTAGQEGQIYSGLEALSAELLARVWKRADGAVMNIGRGLVDANWGQSTDTIYLWCRQGNHGGLFLPAHGKFVGASGLPWEQYTRREGETLGHHWMLPSVKAKRAVRHVADRHELLEVIHSLAAEGGYRRHRLPVAVRAEGPGHAPDARRSSDL